MKENVNEQINDYLSGAMSEEGRVDFEARMAADEDLAQTVRLYATIEAIMSGENKNKEAEDQLRLTLSSLNAQYFGPKPEETPSASPVREPGKIRALWWKVAAAAAVLGLVVLGIFWYGQKEQKSAGVAGNDKATARPDPVPVQTPSQEEDKNKTATLPATPVKEPVDAPQPKPLSRPAQEALFARYFKPDATPDEYEESLEQAFLFYEAGDYNEAIATFEQMEAAPLTRGETFETPQALFYLHYYKALSYLAMDSATAAIPILEKAESTDPLLQSKKDWYLALAYMQTGRLNKATTMLQQLAERKVSNKYRQQAQRLLETLKKD